MACGATGSDPVDALAQFSVLSLFPGVLQNVTEPYDLERELDSLHSQLGTIAMRSPKNLFNQAKAVVQSCSELLNTNVTSEVAAEEQRELDVAKANKNPKMRRPGLGHKPPKFSLKPDPSQAAISLEDAFDIDSYEDPDEFFAAYGRFERAKREIMRQNGTVLEDQGQHILTDRRPRRPGLLGRSYKNRFSESGVFPAEILMEAYVALSNSSEQQYARAELNDESEERDVPGSIKEKKGNKDLLDNLLSQNLEDLDGDGAANLLQDHLQIKFINVENLQLPDLQAIRKDDLNVPAGNLSKQRTALLDIQNLMKGPDRHSPSKYRGGSESSKSHLSSQSARKSPFAQISLLKQRLFRESTSIDPFSSSHVDEVDVRNSLDAGQSERHSDDDNKRKKSGISSNHPDESVSVPLDRRDFDVEIESNSNHDLQNRIGNCNTDLPVMTECLDRSDNDSVGQAEKEVETSTQLNAGIEDSNYEPANEDGDFLGPLISSIVEEFAGDGSSKCADGVLEHQMEEPRAASPNRQSEIKSSSSRRGRKRKDASNMKSTSASKNPVVTECQPAKKAHVTTEELNEEAPREMHNDDRELRPRPQKPRLKKETSHRRTSLGGAGTTWANGVRRSTRIRSRPLAYWKGERFLYGRIHESLATVIGVKYESPGKADGKPGLKVKSFVSDEYKELLELVA